jgi:bacteriorhodopsin
VIYGLWTVVGLVALVLIVVTLVSLFRNPRISVGEKAVWVVAVIIFPLLGSLVYFTVRRDW